MKTADLKDALLDYWVAKADQQYEKYVNRHILIGAEAPIKSLDEWLVYSTYSPSTDWAQGGLLAERELISVSYHEFHGDGCTKPATEKYWRSYFWAPPMKLPIVIEAATPLLAICLCYVTMKFGYEVKETHP